VQFDLTLPDDSNEYRETWEASRVPLVDSDQFESEESTQETEESDFEDDDIDQQIQQTMIHPPSYLMATTSTTTTQAATMTAQPPTQSTSTSMSMAGTTSADVLRSLQQALRRHTGGGGLGGGGGGGGPGPGGGAPGPGQNVAQQPAQPPHDVKMMGALPGIFAGNREQADNFVEQLKGYIRLNRLVPGMNSYIQ